jgi:type IV pilus assembly protein PilX
MDHQSGAALIIGLLILLVMTVIGVSALNTTTMDSRIAANVQNANIGFQVADSSNNQTIAAMMEDEKIKNCAINKSTSPTDPTHDVTHTNLNGTHFASESKVAATGRTNPFGSTLNVGSANRKIGYAFDINSTGRVTGTNTAVETMQGVKKEPYPYVNANQISATCPTTPST